VRQVIWRVRREAPDVRLAPARPSGTEPEVRGGRENLNRRGGYYVFTNPSAVCGQCLHDTRGQFQINVRLHERGNGCTDLHADQIEYYFSPGLYLRPDQ